MEIRSVTLFCEPDTTAAPLADFLQASRRAFPVPVQTTRLATTPFPDWFASSQPAAVREQARDVAATWQTAGANYISVGPVQLRHDPTWLDAIPALLTPTDVIFATAEIADGNGRIDTHRAQHHARIIQQVSAIIPNGFGNLYLAALAHCAPGSPFFPVAYHRGGAPHFALAVESADLALDAIRSAATLEQARANLVNAITSAAASLAAPAQKLAAQFGLDFSGIDFSLAPYPTDDKSLGGALEALGVPHVGAAGSLFAAAFVTEAIDRADFPRCGFSGLMLPVLEDSVLARRAAAGTLRLGDLLSYAAVCGVGLDTIPLPGDVSVPELTAVLLDVAALASRLRKPLTARLMPLPGLAAGDSVTFDFPYFADSRVMAVAGSGVSGLMAQPARLVIDKVMR